MNFAYYQESAEKTAIYDRKYAMFYPELGLAGEAGEVAEKVKKLFRDQDGEFDQIWKLELTEEIGDVLWYLAAICRDFDIKLETAARLNLEKLASRQKRGKLTGSGDNR